MNSPLSLRTRLFVGDITKLDVDAVVTAANSSLLGGGGVDGAIHRAAGPGLLAECRTIGWCEDGEAKITGGHQLPVKHVIHTIGPVWEGGEFDEAEVLRRCYMNSLAIAGANGVKSIAFPCIATGVYGFPKNLACDIAVETVAEWLNEHEIPNEVVFCCYEDEDADLYRRRLADWV